MSYKVVENSLNRMISCTKTSAGTGAPGPAEEGHQIANNSRLIKQSLFFPSLTRPGKRQLAQHAAEESAFTWMHRHILLCDQRTPQLAWLSAKCLLDQEFQGPCIPLLLSPKSWAGHKDTHADVASAFPANEAWRRRLLEGHTVTSWVTITQGALSWNGLQSHTRDQSSMSAGCLGISFPLNFVLLLSCFFKIICCFRFKVYLYSGQYKHRGFQLYSPERKMRQCSHTAHIILGMRLESHPFPSSSYWKESYFLISSSQARASLTSLRQAVPLAEKIFLPLHSNCLTLFC